MNSADCSGKPLEYVFIFALSNASAECQFIVFPHGNFITKSEQWTEMSAEWFLNDNCRAGHNFNNKNVTGKN